MDPCLSNKVVQWVLEMLSMSNMPLLSLQKDRVDLNGLGLAPQPSILLYLQGKILNLHLNYHLQRQLEEEEWLWICLNRNHNHNNSKCR